MNAYDRGDTVVLSAAITDRLGAPTDPSALVLTIDAPDGTRTTRNWPPAGDILHLSTGMFESDLAVTLHGAYRYRWEATGLVQAAEEEQLYVRRSLVPAAP